MALQTEILRVAANTTTGIQTITTSFQPKAAIFIMGSPIADATTTGHVKFSVGYSDGTNGIVTSGTGVDGSTGGTVYEGGKRAGEVILFRDNAIGGAIEAEATIDSFNTTSIKINWTTAPASAYLITIAVLGGSDMEASVGTFLSNATLNGTVDVTVGFKSDLIFLLGDFDHFQYTPVNSYSWSIGACDSALNQTCFRFGETNGANPTECSAEVRNDSAIMFGNSNWEEITAIGSTTFTGTTRGVTGGIRYGYLALNLTGASVKVHNDTTPASPGDISYNLGFEPIFCLHLQSLVKNLNQNAIKGTGTKSAACGAYSIGAYTLNEQFNNNWQAEDNVSTSRDKGYTSTNPIEIYRGDGVLEAKAILPTPASDLFNSTGIKLHWAAPGTDGSSRHFSLIAFANDPDLGMDVGIQEADIFEEDRVEFIQSNFEVLDEAVVVVDSDSFTIDPDFLFMDVLPEGYFPPAEQLIGSKDNPAAPVRDIHYNFGTPYTPGQAGDQNYYISAYEKSTTSVVLAKDKIYYLPLYVAYPILITEMGVHITAADDGKCAKIGLYNFSRGIPKELIFNTAIDLGGLYYTYAPCQLYLSAGLYLLAILSESSTVAMYKNLINKSIFAQDHADGAGYTSVNKPSYLTENVTFASGLPSLAGAVSLAYDDSPRILCKLG